MLLLKSFPRLCSKRENREVSSHVRKKGAKISYKVLKLSATYLNSFKKSFLSGPPLLLDYYYVIGLSYLLANAQRPFVHLEDQMDC